MTTLTGFAPEKGLHFTATRFVDHVPELDFHEKAKNIEFFENAVRKGTYGLCEALYKENEIRSMGYAYRPDMWFAILVYPLGADHYVTGHYVTRYLPGCQADYTIAQIDKWVREFDGESTWCVKPIMRYVPDPKDEELYDVDPDARPTITNDTF